MDDDDGVLTYQLPRSNRCLPSHGNVIVYRRDGNTHVSAIDAERMLSLVGNEQLAPIAADVRQRLAVVVARGSQRRCRTMSTKISTASASTAKNTVRHTARRLPNRTPCSAHRRCPDRAGSGRGELAGQRQE
jgi:hypothetical protein